LENKRVVQVLLKSRGGRGVGVGGRCGEVEVAQTIYTHVSKCKSNKIKGEKKKKVTVLPYNFIFRYKKKTSYRKAI
jgi:hypothetical protein